MNLRGTVHKYGDNVDTDVIIPGRYCNLTEAKDLAAHCLEDLDLSFVGRVKPGDLLVAGENFGCGSSREVAPITIKAAGITAVVAKSFARIFFRNSINIGLPIFECPAAVDGTESGEELEVDVETGKIQNWTKGKTYQAAALPPEVRAIVEAGGLIEYVKRRVAASAPG
ncbi:MAG TPA: 3-isopropylmalate dehydratase small subunit [Planctomycetota bacterium]|jgi:3-isopropylmalate/(R)-2-methylmalate dehydratase small subunit|nr:3-isopropylmalate dehydratase small subunit [Planctomycetota bacterium]